MEKKFRSSCLIASSLDILGDKWTLLIVRDMLLHQKKSFKEFTNSPESIATNLLSARLKLLESYQILTKNKRIDNRKENVYLLTEKGINLAPLILELVSWSDTYLRDYNPEMNEHRLNNMSKQKLIIQTQKSYRSFVADSRGELLSDLT